MIIQNNSDITLDDIKHISKFGEQGKQGLTGLCEIRGEKLVYKISLSMNYVTEHEFNVMKGLEEINKYCPHFCNPRYILLLPINPNFKNEDENPFESSHHKPIYTHVLFMEYIEGIPFIELIEKNTPFHIIMSVIKQVCCAILLAQEKKFTHYDLHSLNILISKTDENICHIYKSNQYSFVVPTYGYTPVIIDYGFSTITDIYNKPVNCPLAFTDSGYLSPVYDPIADLRVFLVSVLDDLRSINVEYTENKDIRIFRNIVHNIFDPLDIDWYSGWDLRDDRSLLDQCFVPIENIREKSVLFDKYPHFCMDILQSLVNYPFVKYNVKNASISKLRKAYQWLVYEFEKIEREINNTFYALYVFRNIIDIAKLIKSEYVNDPENSVAKFKKGCINCIDTIAKFCTLKDVDFKILLLAIYTFGQQLEVELSTRLQSYIRDKNNQYMKLSCNSIEKACCILDVNYPEKINVEDTIFYIFDKDKHIYDIVQFENDENTNLEYLNNLTTIYLGKELEKYI
jgi:serine/threonine protein kinase